MYRKILFIAAFISLITVGCKKDFLDLNVDPNNPATVAPSKILPAALAKTASLMVDPNLDYPNIWMGFWSFSSTYAIPTTERDYTYPSSSYRQNFFTNGYTNAYDYQMIINIAQSQNNQAFQGIGRIMKAFVMQMEVDLYGDVPYTEAFKTTANQTPKYDKASDIYDSLYAQLTVGINNLKAADTTKDFPDATSDIMFQGSRSKWVKFANTLKLKLLIRQATVTAKASYISAKIASDFAPDLSDFLQAKEIAQINPGYTNSTNQQNPFWVNFGYSLTNTVTQGSNLDVYNGGLPAINFFCNMNDLRVQRLMDYYNYNTTGNDPGVDINFYNFVTNSTLGVAFMYGGTEMGAAAKAASGSTLPTTFSTITNNPVTTLMPVKSASTNALIFSDFESLFLQAEAVQRGWFANGNAQQLFDDGMTQSFAYDFDIALTKGRLPLTKYGVTSATIQNDIIASPDNDWPSAQGAGQEIQAIITQKYMALGTYNFLEPWTEYRRTGFPKVDISTSANGHPIPYRYLYPQREYSVNSANVPQQATNAQFNSKLFWMP